MHLGLTRGSGMVNIYESLYEDDGLMVSGRTKLFIKQVEDDGTIGNHDYGTVFTPNSSGTLFIVDDWLIPQIDKVRFKDGTLKVKDGEQLDEPVKSEKEKQREELLRQLALLDADTEETTDEPTV